MITINFNNPNSRTLTNIDLYREPVGTEIPDVPVNPPIATLDGFETQYVDRDTVLGQDYNYRFRVYKQGGESVMSPNIVLGDVSLYGPGTYDQAESGTDTIWSFGLVDAGEASLLPSVTDLANVGGPGIEFKNWNGRWLKFKVGSDIYYTLATGVIKIPTDNFEAFMSRAGGGSMRNVDVGYCSYEYIKSIDNSVALAILDGQTPTKWNIAKQYPRQNALRPIVGQDVNSYMVFAIANESNGQSLVQQANPYAPCRPQSIYMNTHYNYEWYWKPIIRFLPKTDRNYS
ncbi:virion structural protein [Pseudomonas phage 201phi2-1]|uniref:Virion structural protein n=1 Tax=Pseudomonas phage 201phi2-1 TaxID=198110 RepID=B3FJU8_BP201|nr:virion structural protein [Pseudomonas phage 201phi2-1]ABY63263.1 virion structural protein [Pseudomonas phage 201phi2-1]